MCRDLDGDWVDLGEGPARNATVRRRLELAICEVCAVREPCLDFALTNRMSIGIWGGALPKARTRVKTKAKVSGSK